MRRLPIPTSVLCVVLLNVACGPDGSAADLTVSSSRYNFTLKTSSEGTGLVEDAEQFNPAFSSVDGTCDGRPCAKQGAFNITVPPFTIWAGPWTETHASLELINEDGDDGALVGFNFSSGESTLVVDFLPPKFSDSGDRTVLHEATVQGSTEVEGEAVAVKGTFRFER